MTLKLFALAALGALCLQATDQAYLPSSGAGACKITGVSGSPSTLTCAAPHGFSDGQVVVITNVQGVYGINWVWKVNSHTSTTFTVKDGNTGTPISATGTYAGPPVFYGRVQDSEWGYANPASTLYALAPHPRGANFDGPSGALTLSLSDTTANGKANASAIGRLALDGSYSACVSSGWLSHTYMDKGGGCLQAAALECNILGVGTGCSSGTLYNNARQLVLNPAYVYGYGPGAGDGLAAAGLICDTTQVNCGIGDNISYMSTNSASLAVQYELMHSTFSSAQLHKAIDFLLNDLARSKGGLGIRGDPTTDCGTLPTSGTSGSPAIWDDTGNECGLLRVYKSHVTALFSNPTYYPTNGGIELDGSNQGMTAAISDLYAGALSCGDDGPDPFTDRGCVLLSMTVAYMWNSLWPRYFGNYGIPACNDYYNGGRCNWMVSQASTILKNSVPGFPDLTASINDDTLYMFPYLSPAYNPNEPIHYGQTGGYNDIMWNAGPGGVGGIPTNWQFASSAAKQAAMYWMAHIYNALDGTSPSANNIWSVTGLQAQGINYVPGFYMNIDPATTQANITGLPLQRRFRANNSGQCTALGINCTTQYPYESSVFASRTGWDTSSGSNDSVVAVFSRGFVEDGHGSDRDMGVVREYYKQCVKCGDSAQRAGNGTDYDVPSEENHIQLNGVDTYSCDNGLPFWYPRLTRFAQGTTGPSSDDYAYGRVDLTATYCATAGVTHLWKDVFHFKKPGGQNYVVVHVDGASSSPVSLREGVLYRNKQDLTDTTFSPGTSASGRSVSMSDTTTGAQVQSVYLNITGTGTDTYFQDLESSWATGVGTSSGATHKFYIGTSNDGSTLGAKATAEWAYVDAPGASSSISGIVSQPTCTATAATCGAIQISDTAHPAVAVFGRNGSSMTDINFTSTFGALLTGKYVFSDIAAGNYTPYINGVPLATCNGASVPCAVAADDNTLSFDGGPGIITLNAAPPPCTITQSSPLTGGSVGAGYSQTIATTNCVAPVAWTITSGALCAGLSLGASTGTISGTPTTQQTCNFTAHAVDNLSTSDSKALQISIGPARTTSVSGTGSISGNVIIH